MKRILLSCIFSIIISLVGTGLMAQTEITSLAELKDHLDDSDGNFVMTPGTYYFNTDNCGPGKMFSSPNILLFTGDNCVFDFTGVKFEFDTDIFAVYTSWAVNFWPTGDNNIYRNLTMENTGMTTPNAGGEAIHFDGNDNLIEGFYITVRGSYPYGYGDIFGKGGGSVIGHKKRAGILVRGDRNHVKDCTVMMESYGHGIFMQGAKDALIEGCHVEGQLRTVKEVLEEEGTGTPADNVDFMSVWGYDLRELEYDYHFSLQEDGIRSYTTGLIYGTDSSRSTTGTQVVNCTVIKMRSGVTIGWDYTDKRVEGCTVLACETGYWFGGNTTAINCSGDASVGPLVSEDVSRSNSTMEVTLLDNYVTKLGNTPYFFFGGTNHNLTINDGTTGFDDDVVIQVGGMRLAHRWLIGSGEEPWDREAKNCTLVNNTKYPILLEDNAISNTISSCGDVTNNGSSNSITQLSDCDYQRPCSNSTDNLQAECYDDMSGVETSSFGDKNEKCLTSLNANDWISFNNIDLINVGSVEITAATDVDGVAIEVRQDSIDGTLLTTVPVTNTLSFETYAVSSEMLNELPNDTVDIYFVVTGGSGDLLNLDKISFVYDACAIASYYPFLPIGAELFCSSSDVLVDGSSVLYQQVSEINNGDYLRFSNVDFGDDNVVNAIEFQASSATEGGTIEVRSGAIDGELLATVDVENTGSWDDYSTFIGYTDDNITGVHDIYLVFIGSDDDFLMNVDNFYFVNDLCAGRSYEAYNQIEAEDYCETYGCEILDDTYLGVIQAGDWIRFSNVDFTSTSPLSVTLSLASQSSAGNVNVILDDVRHGTLIATIPQTSTGSWTAWREFMVGLDEEVTGVHDVYVYFADGGCNINWLQFTDVFVKGPTDPYERFEAEINDDEDGTAVKTTTDIDGQDEVGGLVDGDYIMFSDINIEEAISLDVRVASALSGGVIEVRVGSAVKGDIIAFVDVPNTGDSSIWTTVNTAVDYVEGENDIYFVFKGDGENLFQVNWLQFIKRVEPSSKLEVEEYTSASEDVRTPSTSTDDTDDSEGEIISYMKPDYWVSFTDVDLSNAESVSARYATNYDDVSIEVRIDSLDGELIGTIELASSGGWSDWATASANLSSVSGVHDVYFVYQTESSTYACHSNWFQFSEYEALEGIDAQERIEFEDYDRVDGPVVSATTDVDGFEILGSITDDNWILFKNIDLTDMTNIDVRYATSTDGVRLDIRLGSYNGDLMGFISLPNTNSEWATFNYSLLGSAEGLQDVYFICQGEGADLFQLNWFQFHPETSAVSENAFMNTISLYPNPVNQELTITEAAGATVELYNMLGRIISRSTITSNKQTIDFSQLTEGYYLVKATKADGKTETFKVIKK